LGAGEGVGGGAGASVVWMSHGHYEYVMSRDVI